MTNRINPAFLSLLQSVPFSAIAHRHQVRKDGITPYSAHPFRVCLILSQLFGIADPQILTTALLHDTIEDTTTDFDDLNEKFGDRVAKWVSCLTKDKRLVDEERETRYFDAICQADWQVKVCKLADMLDNLVDCKTLPPKKQEKAFLKTRAFLGSLKSEENPDLLRAIEIVERAVKDFESNFVIPS